MTNRRGDSAPYVRYEYLMRRRKFFVLTLPSLLLATGVQASPPQEGASAARALEARLRAPCCWVQTLDVHESEPATKLRDEIHTRLQQGETSAAIEEDLVVRYGERIRAVHRENDPMDFIPAFVGAGMMTSLFGLSLVIRRWKRRVAADLPKSEPPKTPMNTKNDDYDARLDDELAQLDNL